jgi:hypothetical protein
MREGGQPLDPGTQTRMAAALGHRFHDVRVHTGPDAARAAAAFDADALTLGREILFAAGRYRPETAQGRRLLAHELVHALQHGQPTAGREALAPAAPVRPRDDSLEREADAAANRVAAGGRVPPGLVTLAAPQAGHQVALAPAAPAPAAPVEVPDSPEAVRDLADEVARLFAYDPDDLFGRVRRRLARLAPGTRRALLGQLQDRIPAAAQTRLAELLVELAPAEPDAAEPAQAPQAATERIAARPEAEVAEEAATEVAERPGPAEEPAAAEVSEEQVAGEPARPEAGAEPTLELEAVEEPEAVVDAPQLEDGEAARMEAPEAAEPEGEAAEPEPAGPATAPGTAPPTPAEGAGPAEGAADTQPADELDSETVDSLDEAEAQDLGERPEETVPATPRTPTADEADLPPEVAAEAAAPEAGGAEAAPAPIDEEVVPTGEPPTPEAESDLPDPGAPEPESEEEAAVEEPPAAEMEAETEAPGVEAAPDQEPEGVADLETGAETETGVESELALETAETEEPAPETGEGGGVPIEAAEEPETPDLAASDPEAALATAVALPPAQALQATAGVSAAVTGSVGAKRADLAANPPRLERPTGAPTGAELAEEAAEATGATGGVVRLERAPEAPASPLATVPPLPPAPVPATQDARLPQITGGPTGELDEAGARAVQSSIRQLPVTDPGLALSVGPAPRLDLEGAADPQRVGEQRLRLDQAAADARARGAQDIVQPIGRERDLRPDVEPETLQATLGPAGAAGPAATPAPAAVAPAAGPAVQGRAVSVLAAEQRRAEIRSAAAQARAGMVSERRQHEVRVADEQARSQAAVAELVSANAAEQTRERRGASADVLDQRRRWNSEQRAEVGRAHSDADTVGGDAAAEIQRQQTSAEMQVTTYTEQGDREAEAARRDGEQRAARERERGERESSGVLGWLARKAEAFFDRIKQAISKVFEAARAAVRAAIERAKRLATAVIERARQAVVAAIRKVGDALIAIGDRLLGAFPELRQRFRAAIKERVAKAEAAVNALADGLKQGVQKALDALGAGLDAALSLLEKGLLAYVDLYASAVRGAISFAQGVMQALAAFAVLIDDIAANPLQWLSNLGASAKDGVRNHLWKAFKAAIRRWFNEKLEEVLGLGLTIWNLLKKGGIPIARIGMMAWEGLKAAIPPTLIQLLVEKLVAMIVPAIGAILTIIEGLRAAWGTVQRVLEAFERFLAFLKAVRTGRAGPHFANTLAAAAIAVIDFVANWLLMRLRKPAGALAKKIRAIAKKIGAKLGRLAKKIGKKFFKGRKPKVKGKPSRKPKPDKQAKAERRVRAASEFLERQLARGMPYPILRAQMLYARARYRVRLRLRDRNDTATLVVEANPRKPLPLRKDYAGKIPVGEYRARAEEFLGWIARHHDLHHILPKERQLSRWWRALGIDFNHPTLMLELPPFLHQSSVHRGWRRIRSELSKKEQANAVRQLKYGWNTQWDIWIMATMRAAKVNTPAELRGTAPGQEQRRAELRNDVNRRIDWMLGIFSAKARYDLRRFRISEGRGAPYRQKYRKQMASFINGLKAHANNPMKIRAWISSWLKGRRLSVRLTKKQARTLMKYWKQRG